MMEDYILVDGVLCHHGIQGQKWGVRRYQNEDGSLTEAGRKRYGYGENSTSKAVRDFNRTSYKIAKLTSKRNAYEGAAKSYEGGTAKDLKRAKKLQALADKRDEKIKNLKVINKQAANYLDKNRSIPLKTIERTYETGDNKYYLDPSIGVKGKNNRYDGAADYKRLKFSSKGDTNYDVKSENKNFIRKYEKGAIAKGAWAGLGAETLIETPSIVASLLFPGNKVVDIASAVNRAGGMAGGQAAASNTRKNRSSLTERK